MSTRQYGRLLRVWVSSIEQLRHALYAAGQGLAYPQEDRKLASRELYEDGLPRCLGIEVGGALAISEVRDM